MRKMNLNIKEKCFLLISFSLLLISIGIETKELGSKKEKYKINYEYVNIKDMAAAKIANKKSNNANINNSLSQGKVDLKTLAPAKIFTTSKKGTLEEVALPTLENTDATRIVPKQVWHLPTKMGAVSQNPHYGHVALDITSPRGSSELIFPVANGTITGIYKDNAGAKIVTILHNIDGRYYTSQYVHLSKYASNIYVGKVVTINDSIGYMGTTGISTGVHLHLAVLDCALFNSNDSNCKDLNNFFNYANKRLSQGYIGLGSMMNVPGVWYSR